MRQATIGSARIPGTLQSFAGLNLASNGAGWPPDTNGDVGPNHYIQTVNTSVGIYSKTGTPLVTMTINALFSGTGTPCDNNNQGDPQALYDAIADRWLVTDFAWSSGSGPFYECIAVSQGADPVSSGWYFYAFEMTSPSGLNDYPKFGIWSDGYYMSANMFNASGTVYLGAKVFAFDRSKMTSGLAVTPVSFFLSCGGTCYSSLLPGNLRGTLPPAGTPDYFASIDTPSSPYTANTIHVWKFHFDSVTPGNSTFTGPTDVTVATFTQPCSGAIVFACVPQQSGESVDSLGDRLMTWLQYRNISGAESLWVAHTVANSASVGSPTGIRWYQLNVTGGTIATAPVQQSTFMPDSLYRWMPSLAVNKNGDMAVGYSASSSSMFPAIRYTGRLATDALNNLCQGEGTLIAGTGSQSGGFNRWGDYSAMTIDPTDDLTFWYTNEYYQTTGSNWQTRIGSFKLPEVPGTPGVGPFIYFMPQISKHTSSC